MDSFGKTVEFFIGERFITGGVIEEFTLGGKIKGDLG